MTISATTQGLRMGVATSTSRPTVPFDGQVIYETDTDLLKVYNGTSWVVQTGGVLQVKNAGKATAFTTTSSSYVDVTDLSISITPTLSTNKVLVLMTVQAANTGGDGFVQLIRDSTPIGVSTVGTTKNGSGVLTATSYNIDTIALAYLDSPSTTSSTTYKVQAAVNGGTTYINRRPNDTAFGAYSTITVMEVTP